MAKQGLRVIFQRPVLMAAGLVLLGLAIVAVFAPLISPYNADTLVGSPFSAPSAAHWMGTDQLGRDIFSRVLVGLRVTLLVGVAVVLISGTLGTLIGTVSGFRGGALDGFIMRVNDLLLAFPSLLLALVLVTVFSASVLTIIVAISILFVPSYARVARAVTLDLRAAEFVQGARVLGLSDRRIIFRHMLPNMSGPLIVQSTVGFAFAVLVEASLSYLGLGVPPPTPTLGAMLQEGQGFVSTSPWEAIFPGLVIALMIFASTILGDALRDLLDPRSLRSGLVEGARG